ncbi:MAG: class I SAM-dependent methyltransferase [Gammaproteobacteria bacterium]|nr:class I SAM-dependent methyltransferase [Gammaproteobacteria bacterium]MDE0366621.1 class I SAM-dependent methyltransferase [Gammaproteobacteria bacterium]
MARKEGSDSHSHVIPQNVTRTQCIGYTQRFIVGRETPHYRYDRYQNALKTCVQNVPFDQDMSTAMHLDLGAGPGLFSWALWDLMHDETTTDRRPSLDLFGYDYAPQMATLARRIWDRFELPAPYRCFDSEEEVYANVWPQGPPTNVLITLGHSLIQVHENDGLAVFAELCEAVAGLDRHTRLVAIDAHSGDRVRQFDSAWRQFLSMMAGSRVTVIHEAESIRVSTVELVSGPWRRQ